MACARGGMRQQKEIAARLWALLLLLLLLLWERIQEHLWLWKSRGAPQQLWLPLVLHLAFAGEMVAKEEVHLKPVPLGWAVRRAKQAALCFGRTGRWDAQAVGWCVCLWKAGWAVLVIGCVWWAPEAAPASPTSRTCTHLRCVCVCVLVCLCRCACVCGHGLVFAAAAHTHTKHKHTYTHIHTTAY